MTLEKASKIDMIRTFGRLTLDKVITDNYPTIGAVERMHGQEKVEKVIMIIITDLSRSFKGLLDKDDVEEIMVEITTSLYRNLTLEDVFIVCQNIKKAKLHGKLDLNMFMNHLENHFNKRIDKITTNNRNQHLATKTPSSNRTNDKIESMVSGLFSIPLMSKRTIKKTPKNEK